MNLLFKKLFFSINLINNVLSKSVSNDIDKYIGILFGFLFGILVLFVGFYFIYTVVTTRKSTGDPPMNPKVAAAIRAIGPIAGNSNIT